MASNLIGRIKESLGWLTADRRTEAEGRLQQLDDGSGPDDEAAADDAVEQAERDVRRDYGEYDPAVDGAEPAADVMPADEERG